MKWARVGLLLLVIATLAWPSLKARAAGPSCTFNDDGSITCTVEDDGGEGGEGGEGGDPTIPPFTCTPGETMRAKHYVPNGDGTCSSVSVLVDQCTGGILDILADDFESSTTCPSAPAPKAGNPCTTFKINQGGVTCGMEDGWKVQATVHFPETFLDVRPFPATLVRWPTALRNGGQPSASGSGSQGYYGSGSASNPSVGDKRDITLRLTLNPASPLFVTLPKIGGLSLSDQGESGTPQIVQWEVPSHPEAGGGPLAGSISGLDELPADMPLFVGQGRSAYKLFWNLSYDEYVAVRGCLDGPNGKGQYNCNDDTGHTGIVGYEWRRRSSGGEIPPSVVANLPGSLAADLNGDGNPDAYWDRNLTLRRMDEAGSINNPTYRRSWSWGGLIYWAVREGQGQIGWPGGQ
jgi:hypothetical protein